MGCEGKKEYFMAAANLMDEMFALKKLLIERFED